MKPVMKCLVFLGKLLTHHFRKSDFACRFGGEEFIVVLMNSWI